MKNSTNFLFASHGTNLRKGRDVGMGIIEVIDLTNDDNSIFIETCAQDADKYKQNTNIMTVSHKTHQVKQQCLTQQNDIVRDSHSKNVHTIGNPFVRHGIQDSLSQEIPKKCKDNSASTTVVARHIPNLERKSSGRSQEQENKNSSYKKHTVNDTEKNVKLCNQPDKQRISDFKVVAPSKNRKSSAEYSSVTSGSKNVKHAFMLINESTPKIKHSFPNLSSVKANKTLFAAPQEQVKRATLLNYFKPISNNSAEKTTFSGHSLCSNILESTRASKEGGDTILKLVQENNHLKCNKKGAIFQDCDKNYLSSSSSASEGKSNFNHCKETKSISTLSKSSRVFPKVLKRHLSPTTEKISPSKKKKTDLIDHLFNGKHLSKNPGDASIISIQNHEIKKKEKDFQQCEQTLRKCSTEMTAHTNVQKHCKKKLFDDPMSVSSGVKHSADCNISEKVKKCSVVVERLSNKVSQVHAELSRCGKSSTEMKAHTNIQKHCKKKLFDDPVSVSSGVKHSADCNISEKEKKCLEIVETELNKVSPVDAELSKCGIKVSSSQNKKPVTKSHKHSGGEKFPTKSHDHFGGKKTPTKSHSHSGGKNQIVQGYNIQENKCDISKSNHKPYSEFLHSTNTVHRISSKHGMDAFSSQNKNSSGKQSHRSLISSPLRKEHRNKRHLSSPIPEGDRNKRFKESIMGIRSQTKDHKHSGNKQTSIKSHNHSESKCDITKSKDIPHSDNLFSTNTVNVELHKTPSKCEMNASSLQSKNYSDRYSHSSFRPSLVPAVFRIKNFKENKSPTKSHKHHGEKNSSTKIHSHFYGKKQLVKNHNIHETKSDSTNTKCKSEKLPTDLNLEKKFQTSPGRLEPGKSISTEVHANFRSHKEYKSEGIKKPVICRCGTSSNTESCKTLNQTFPGNSHNCSQSSISASKECSKKKVTIDVLVSTLQTIFSDHFYHPWLQFDTSGIPSCCSTNSCDDKLQFNILCNINNMINLDLPVIAVDHFSDFIMSYGVPDTVSVQKIIQLMMKMEHVDVLYAAQASIQSLLSSYPPCFVHSASYYRGVFASQHSKNSPVPEGLIHYLLNQLFQESENCKDENFVLACENTQRFSEFSDSSDQAGDSNEDSVRHEKCVYRILFILSSLRDSLASDFSNWIFKYGLNPTHSITKMATQPLIATAIWPRSMYHTVGAVKGVICLLMKCCMKLWSFKNLSANDKSVLMELLHMAAEVIRYCDPRSDNNYPFFGPACDVLANKVCNYMNELDAETKEHFLHSLKPDWLAMKVGSLLIAQIIHSAPPRALSAMVSIVEEHYFLHKSGGFVEPSPNHLQNNVAGTTKLVNINKRNARGEVMLHVACRNGNLEKVTSLLNDPDIRVNAQDNAGWTPLQEAIVKNRIECIEALLKYNPPNGERVDTSLACFLEGTTPLMTAANYSNLPACKMLLEHSGSSLLKDQDSNGNTVFYYAHSEELKSFLADAEHKYKCTKKRPTINLTAEGWRKLEPLLCLTIFKYLSTFKIIEITETLKAKKGSHLKFSDLNVDTYLYKKDYVAYRAVRKLTKNDTEGDVILDKLKETLIWYLADVLDHLELNC